MVKNIQHAVIRVSDIAVAKEFYLNKLGLELLEDSGNFFAAKAGNIRLSVFGGYEKAGDPENPKTGVSLIFRVDNLEKAIEEYKAKGVPFFGEIIDIPNFHKFMESEDPDGNVFFLAEYHKEPV
ncbi:MAG: VOC family protein [Ignavibacteria bacterium]|nr:VOC family protein [Ignavibacteria bacterium]